MKILIIDDEPLIQEIIESYLSPLQAQVTKFSNILDAKQLLNKESVDLIISDFHMPEGSGLDLINYLRKQNNNTPIILMSGSIIQGCEALKFSAFIKKPVPPAELLNLVKKLTPNPKIGIKP